MTQSVNSSSLHRSTLAAGSAVTGRLSQTLPENAKLLDTSVQSLPGRLTLPKRNSENLQRQSADLQALHMSRSGSFANVEGASSRSATLVSVPEKSIEQQRKEHARLGLDLNNVRENDEKAKTVGVDVAKKTFWSKLAGVAVSAIAAGVVVGLAVATGGVGLAVAAGIAGVVLAKQAADTRCAQKVLQNERAMAQGKDAPHKDVPMGADWVANKMYTAISKMKPNMSEASKMSIASKISTGVNITLAIASVANGGISGALAGESLLLTALPASISVANIGIMHFLGKATANTKDQIKNFSDENMLERFIEVNEKYHENINDSVDPQFLSPENLQAKKDALLQGVENLENDFDAIALRMEEKNQLSNSSNLQGSDDEDLAYVQSILNKSPQEYAEEVAIDKHNQAVEKLESFEKADKLSEQTAKKEAAKEAGVHLAEMAVEIGVEKGVEKAVHALAHAEVDVDVSVMAAFTTLAVLKSAYDLHSAVKELNQVKAPIAKHEQNMAQINRQFEYII